MNYSKVLILCTNINSNDSVIYVQLWISLFLLCCSMMTKKQRYIYQFYIDIMTKWASMYILGTSDFSATKICDVPVPAKFHVLRMLANVCRRQFLALSRLMLCNLRKGDLFNLWWAGLTCINLYVAQEIVFAKHLLLLVVWGILLALLRENNKKSKFP